MLCDDQQAWGQTEGREVQKGGDIFIIMADVHCHMAEIRITL